jgi:hypothetical protein
MKTTETTKTGLPISIYRNDAINELPAASANPEEYVRRMDSWRDSFAQDAIRRQVVDVNESLIFANALEYWIAEAINQPYPELMADSLISMRRGLPPGAGSVVSYGYDKTGEATVLSGLGEDIPRVDLSARRMTSPMIGLAAAFAVSQQQIREAAMAPNTPQIESMGLDAVRTVLAERVDRILALGDAPTGCQGILNVTGVAPVGFTTGGWAPAGATAAQIDADVNTAVAALRLATGNIIRPDTMLLPTIAYSYVKTLPMFAFGTTTILDWIEMKHGLKVIEWWRCDGAGVGGVDRAMIFANRKDVIEGYRSIDVELLAPEYRSTYWLTVGHSRTGGCNSAHTSAIMYYDNV